MFAWPRIVVLLFVVACFGSETGAAGAEERAAESNTTENREEEMIDRVDLEEHRWKDRVILLFAERSEQRDYQKMQEALARESAGVAERDLIIYHLFFDEVGRLNEEPVSSEAAAALASQYDVATDVFTYLLIGKDGGVKMRANEAVSLESIFARIDSMPMRQREMREADH